MKKTITHHGNLRRAAVETGWRIVQEQGPDALSLREVASREGVTHRALYRHFADAQDFEMFVAAEAFRQMAGAIAKMTKEGSRDPADVINAYVRFAVDNPGPYRLMFSHRAKRLIGHVEAGPAVQSVIQIASAAFNKEAASREQIRDDVVAAWAMAHGMLDLWSQGLLRARTLDELCDYIRMQIVSRFNPKS